MEQSPLYNMELCTDALPSCSAQPVQTGWCSVWLLAACGSAVQSLMPSHSKGRPCRAGEFEGPALYQQIARWRFRENTFIDAGYIVPLQLFLPYPPQCFCISCICFSHCYWRNLHSNLLGVGRKETMLEKPVNMARDALYCNYLC